MAKPKRGGPPPRAATVPAPVAPGGETARGVDRAALLPMALLVLLPPFVFSPAAEDSFRQPKLLVSEVLALLGLVALAWRARRAERFDLGAFCRLPVVLATLPVLVAATATLVTSRHPDHVRASLPSLWIGAAAWVGFALALSRDERRRLLRLTLPAGALLAGFALFQRFVANPFGFRTALTERMATVSLAGNVFDLSAYLLVPILVAQAELVEARTARRRAAVGAALAVMLAAVFVAQTLAVLLALLLAVLVWWTPRVGPRRALAWFAVTVVLFAAGAAAFAPLRERVAEKVVDLRLGSTNRLLTGRLDAWRAALWMVGERPFAGVGQGAFRAEFGRAKLALVAAGVPFDPTLRETYFANAHNELLEAAAEWGVLGGLAALWGAAVTTLAVARRGDALAAAGWAALVVLALIDFPLRLALVAYPFLLLLSGGLARGESRAAG